MKSKKLLAIIGAAVIIGSMAGFYYLSPKELPIVEAYEVDSGMVRSTFEETAEVDVDQHKYIYTKLAGNILTFNKRIGDMIEIGEVIATIDTEVLDLEIKGLNADIAALNATYLEALKSVDIDMVNKSRAAIRSAKVSMEESERQYENNKQLYQEGALSLESLNVSESNLKLTKEKYNVAMHDLDILTKGLSKNQKAQYESQISSLESKLEILEKSKNNAIIKSSQTGIVLDTFVNQGQLILVGHSLLEIGTDENLTMRSDILTSDSINIKKGTKVMLMDEDNGLELNALVKLIYPKAFNKVSDLGITQKRVTVELFVSNIDQLKIGYELDAKFVVEEKKKVIRIPERSVFKIDGQDYVFIIEDEVMTLKAIDLGLEGDVMVEVISGLEVGDLVMLSVDDELEEGSQVAYKLEEK